MAIVTQFVPIALPSRRPRCRRANLRNENRRDLSSFYLHFPTSRPSYRTLCPPRAIQGRLTRVITRAFTKRLSRPGVTALPTPPPPDNRENIFLTAYVNYVRFEVMVRGRAIGAAPPSGYTNVRERSRNYEARPRSFDRCRTITRGRAAIITATRERAIETDVTVTNGNTIIFIASPFRGQPPCRIARWARFRSSRHS